MPGKVLPMLCTLVKEPPRHEDYIFEIKWDGYRIISYLNKNKVRLDSRSGKDYTSKYPPVVAALKRLKHDLVLDGEIVVFDKEGLPDFNAVQNYNGHDTAINYFVFDILWIDGYNLKKLSFMERRQILNAIIAENDESKKDDKVRQYILATLKGPLDEID